MNIRVIKLTIAYDGTGFCGWQRQKNDCSVQGTLEEKLSIITNQSVTLHGAGRTDAGVHALAMTAHFRTHSKIPCRSLQKGLNAMLPGAIRIDATCDAQPDFHARFSARGKTYLYRLYTGPIQPPTERFYIVHTPFYLQLKGIRNCLSLIQGTHDFSSFEASGSRDKAVTTGRGAIRTIQTTEFLKTGPDRYNLTITGDGFLRHMVRNLVGTLLDVGRERRTVAEFRDILEAQDRSTAGATAPAHGLYLLKVHYGDDQ